MSTSTVILPKDTTQALIELTGEPRADVALTLVIRDYARHKLADLEAALRQYEEKYQMPFEEYRQIWENEEREEHYTYQAEWDYLEWESLVTRYDRLSASFAWLP